MQWTFWQLTALDARGHLVQMYVCERCRKPVYCGKWLPINTASHQSCATAGCSGQWQCQALALTGTVPVPVPVKLRSPQNAISIFIEFANSTPFSTPSSSTSILNDFLPFFPAHNYPLYTSSRLVPLYYTTGTSHPLPAPFYFSSHGILGIP